MLQHAPYKLLIIDDDPHVHTLLGKMLTREKYSLRSALSAESALAALNQEEPDLVILDIMMPKTSGMEILEIIRKDPRLKKTLILVVSAKDAQSDRIEGLTHGADDYVAKPFHVQHLLRKIEHMLSKEGA